MTVDRLPVGVREFASYLDGLLARLDQGGGWSGVFWQRDPDGMRACLDGREVLPWDVVEALLEDFATAYGPAAAAAERERARALYRAALTAYDARPGARDALLDRLDVMLREQRYAAERRSELTRLLATPSAAYDPASLRLDLAWAQDDHERATARCAELRARLTELDRRGALSAGTARRAGEPGPWWPEGGAREDMPGASRYADGEGRSVEGEWRGVRGPRWAEGGGPEAAGQVASAGVPAAFRDADGEDRSADGDGEGVWRGARSEGLRGAESGPPWAGEDAGPVGQRQPAAVPPRSTDADRPPYVPAPAPAPPGVRPASTVHARAPHVPLSDAAAHATEATSPVLDTTASAPPRVGHAHTPHAPTFDVPAPTPGATTSPPEAGSPAPGATTPGWEATPPAPRTTTPPPPHTQAATPPSPPPGAAAPATPDATAKSRKRRRGSARFAGMGVEGDAAGVVGAPQVVVPEVPARRTPRGARFAGVGQEGEVAVAPVEVVDAEAGAAVAGVVERLARLRAEGRSGEAHALLVEVVQGPVARFPALADALHRAGLGADWATLLWETASLPAERLVAAADALTAAGREADGRQMLRQGVDRPAEQIGTAVLRLEEEGRRREAEALLDACVRVRTAEEAARSVVPDPSRLVPLLLNAAQGVSDERHWDLVHALRVAGHAT
ncbi:hypothetical protein SRB17_76190 [Streptomyces sp. RB17]|uniref:hypothetical protein n=1 Tax=Streptomyces sp. RB17 TaxID=2585197 RepID=UPI001297CB64|nr:hypothetical protein [Streptomyces sp. RB17]MQY39592.1 hypothetical protein [Streptomyces sp. RB17]